MGADRKANASEAAHFRLVMFVSLRMAASAVAPLAPMPLLLRLRARGAEDGNGERIGVSMGADKKANASRGSGTLEVGDLRLVEDGSERGGTLGSDFVVFETACEGQDGKR